MVCMDARQACMKGMYERHVCTYMHVFMHVCVFMCVNVCCGCVCARVVFCIPGFA